MASLHRPISMQITLTPSDLAEARVLLPHQIRVWGNQVDDILVLVDLPPWRSRNQAALQAQHELAGFLDRQRALHPHLDWKLMDYSREAVARVQETFYGGRRVPMHDYRNRPIYGYLHLLLATWHDLVFHIDGDMMFGGGSQTWMAEALDQLTRRPELLAATRFPAHHGPTASYCRSAFLLPLSPAPRTSTGSRRSAIASSCSTAESWRSVWRRCVPNGPPRSGPSPVCSGPTDAPMPCWSR